MMNEQRKADNERVKVRFLAAGLDLTEPERFPSGAWTRQRLRTCQASIWRPTGNQTRRYWLLQSYQTIIAVYDRATMTVFDGLRLMYGYTASSAQHVAKFAQEVGARKIVRFK